MKNTIKNFLRNFLTTIMSPNWIWNLYKPIAELNADIYLKKKQKEKAENDIKFFEKFRYLISDTVQSGPFKGLKYPFLSSLHSTLFPKLLGCYEAELHEVLNKVFHKKYYSILDIGCAEGYYAVGLAKRFPDSIVYAADINPEAREKTKIMAHANGFTRTDTFQVIEEITPGFLLGMDPSQRHLIFSDCEAYESILFSDEVISHLSNSDIIVELHDFICPGVSDMLQKRFELTHSVQLITSIDDLFRYRMTSNPDIKKLPISDQNNILAEKRPTQMEWIFCEARNME